MLSCIKKEKIFTAFTHFQVIFSIFSGKNSTLKYLKKYDWNLKNLNVWIDSWWAPVGSGSGFLNPELLDPDPAENGQAPQPWIKVQLAAPDPPLRELSGTRPRPSRSRRSPAPFFLQRDRYLVLRSIYYSVIFWKSQDQNCDSYRSNKRKDTPPASKEEKISFLCYEVSEKINSKGIKALIR